MIPGPVKTKNTLCVILGGGRGSRLYPLTKMRAKPAVPIGGKYRLIDVPVSNCLHSGLNQMYVLTQFESASLHRHVRETYRFDRFGEGFLEILAAQQTMEGNQWYQGTADAVRQNLVHFGKSWEVMLILAGDQLYRMDFRKLLEYHQNTDADISIAVLPVTAKETHGLGIVKVDETGAVREFCEKPAPEALTELKLETDDSLFQVFGVNPGNRRYLASMGIYLFNRRVLTQELTEHDYVDFGRHLLPASLGRFKMQAYIFDGYWEDIGTVKSFHEANISLAKLDAPFAFNDGNDLIFTRPRTLPGSISNQLQLTESIICDGCRIESAWLSQSVLGIRSIVGKNVRLNRTLVFGADFYETEAEKQENLKLGQPNVGIGDNVIIENAIVDKNVRIGSDVIIRNPASVEPIDTAFYAVRDGVICIKKDAVIHSGTRIGE